MKNLTLILALTSFGAIADDLYKVTCFMSNDIVLRYNAVELRYGNGNYQLIDQSGNKTWVPVNKCIIEMSK